MSTPAAVPLNTYAFVALGSNLGDSARIIERACDCLQGLSRVPLLRSALWRTSPVDCPPGSPPFLNAVVGMVPDAQQKPETLLDQLQAIEKAFGRQPKRVLNEPRPLDLDLITFGAQVLDTPRLILPHPRASRRRFVLQPLAEIAGELVLPGQPLTVNQLLARLEGDERVMPARAPAPGGAGSD